MISIKVVMVGDGAVGKTSFYITFATNAFPEEYTPTVLDEYSANIMLDGRPISVGLWDTAGQEDYDRLRPLSYPQTSVFIVAYSVANPASFQNVTQKWIPEIREHCPEAPFVLFATKTDLRNNEEVTQKLAAQGQSCVTTEQGENLAVQIGADGFFEVSAKTFVGVQAAMEHVVKIGAGLIISDTEPHMPLKPDPPAFVPGADVCDELSLLVNEKLFHDVVFRVKDEEIYCHKFVLCSACPSLHKLITQHEPIGNYFTSSMSDNNNNDVCIVSVSEVSHVELLEFIKFVYNGKAKQSPTNEFMQLAKACDIDYNVNRRSQLKKSIAANVKTMHDIEIIAAGDKKKFHSVKALLWCRSKYFQEELKDTNMKDIEVEAPSSFIAHFLNFVHDGVLPEDDREYMDNEDLLRWSARWSTSMSQTVQLFLVESVINLKNVFEWTNITRARYPELYEYCKWLMRVNYNSIKDKKDFLALKEHAEVAATSWPGQAYETRYKKWKSKKKDRCLVQ